MLWLKLRTEGKLFQSGLSPPPPHGKEMCQASHAGHWAQMPPAFEDLNRWGLNRRVSHWATVQLKVHIAAYLRTSWPAALVSKESEPLLVSCPDMELWANALIHKTAQGINRPIMSRYLKTKKNWTSKDLGRPGIPFQMSAISVGAKIPISGSHFGFEIVAQMANKIAFKLGMGLFPPNSCRERYLSFSWRRFLFWMPLLYLHYSIHISFINMWVYMFLYIYFSPSEMEGKGGGWKH